MKEIKNVKDIIDAIYNDEFDTLPRKIKVEGRIFKKDNDWKNYYSEDGVEECLTKLEGEKINKLLSIPVEKVEEAEGRKWKPKIGEEYWYVYDCGNYISKAIWNNRNIDNYRYYLNDCFRTEKEAEKHKENIQTEIELRKLAEKLNNGEKIDWEDFDTLKYSIVYDYESDCILYGISHSVREPETIYCLDSNFRKEAIKKIGKEKLINYLKGVV